MFHGQSVSDTINSSPRCNDFFRHFFFQFSSASTMLNQIKIEFCHSRFTGMIVHVITFITLSLLLVFLHQNVGSTEKLLTLLIFILFFFDYYAISLRNCFYLVHKSHSNYKLYKKITKTCTKISII